MERKSASRHSGPVRHRTVGFIGLGLLGRALAARTIQAGWRATGFDPDASARSRFQRLGGQPLASNAEVARSSQRLILALPRSRVTRAVAKEIEPALAPGTVILDMTTGDPNEMAALGLALDRRDVFYLDTSVLGSSADVAGGWAGLMVGGSRSVFLRQRRWLRSFSRWQFHLGPCGSGARMKLVVNLVLGLNRAALAEGLAFARATGVDPRRTLAVLRAGIAYSRVMDTKGPKMLARDFKPVARLAQHLKDVRLILDAAAHARLGLPLSRTHKRLLEKVAADGGGDLDNSAVILAYG
jgi:3-hydroxyisobutyrate dehydrogenase-like beta-hydroxyacid dehydrogenase